MKRLISAIVSLVILMAVLAAGYEAFLKKPSVSALTEPVVLGNGMSTSQIADVLKKAGVISSTAVFTVVADLSGSFKGFHAGTFIMKEGMSAYDALKTLSIKGQEEITVTIPEGFDMREIGERLAAGGAIKSADEFYAVAGADGKPNKQAQSLLTEYFGRVPESATLEGFLFPDTYRFYAATDSTTAARRMLQTYKDKIASLSAPPDFKTLIKASLVEKEVKDSADRAKVADIIDRRLAAGMPLQFDSTVNYVTGKNAPSVSLADTAIDSPWNTYKHAGLPLTPICSPGLDSMKAVLTPTPNKYWYFLTKPDGTVVYSTTLDEHNAAKRKYLK